MRRRALALALLTAVVLSLVGTSAASARDAGIRRHWTITIAFFTFHPNYIVVQPGGRIDVHNRDWGKRHAPHTVTAFNGAFDTDLVKANDKHFFAPLTPGKYRFFCEVHPFMKGVLIVKSP